MSRVRATSPNVTPGVVTDRIDVVTPPFCMSSRCLAIDQLRVGGVSRLVPARSWIYSGGVRCACTSRMPALAAAFGNGATRPTAAAPNPARKPRRGRQHVQPLDAASTASALKPPNAFVFFLMVYPPCFLPIAFLGDCNCPDTFVYRTLIRHRRS